MFYPTKTQRITENVYAIRSGFVNLYILTDGDNYICIDTGLSSLFAKMGLKKLGISPDKITHVFLTHTDYDHVGGIKLFKNAKVYISKNEEQMINGTTSRLFRIKYNKLNRAYTTLTDNEEITIGKIKVKAINTPGHTPGSMSYIINDSLLFAGDTLTLRRKKAYPFYWLQNMDTPTQKESIKKLTTQHKELSWIFTAHTGYTADYKSAIERWM